MGHVITICAGIVVSGVLIGYLGMAGRNDLITWSDLGAIGLAMMWSGLWLLVIGLVYEGSKWIRRFLQRSGS